MKNVSLLLSSTALVVVLNNCGGDDSSSSNSYLSSENIENEESSFDTTVLNEVTVPRLKRYLERNREGQLETEIEFFYKGNKLVRMENIYPPRYKYSFEYKGDDIIIKISSNGDNPLVAEKMFYSGDKFLGWAGYREIEENRLKEFTKLEVLSYDGIKPLEIKYLADIDSKEEIPWRKTRLRVIYDGDYVIEAEGFVDDEYENSYDYNRSYSCVTWKDLVGVELQYLFEKSNRCENWTSLTGVLNGENITATQSIIYNKDNLPTRIEKKLYGLYEATKVYEYY